MKAVLNPAIRAQVQNLESFTNKSRTVTGETHVHSVKVNDDVYVLMRYYVVNSYGPHFPIYVFDYQWGTWYGNHDKYSPTTSRHQSLARPYDDPSRIEWRSTEEMISVLSPTVEEAAYIHFLNQSRQVA